MEAAAAVGANYYGRPASSPVEKPPAGAAVRPVRAAATSGCMGYSEPAKKRLFRAAGKASGVAGPAAFCREPSPIIKPELFIFCRTNQLLHTRLTCLVSTIFLFTHN